MTPIATRRASQLIAAQQAQTQKQHFNVEHDEKQQQTSLQGRKASIAKAGAAAALMRAANAHEVDRTKAAEGAQRPVSTMKVRAEMPFQHVSPFTAALTDAELQEMREDAVAMLKSGKRTPPPGNRKAQAGFLKGMEGLYEAADEEKEPGERIALLTHVGERGARSQSDHAAYIREMLDNATEEAFTDFLKDVFSGVDVSEKEKESFREAVKHGSDEEIMEQMGKLQGLHMLGKDATPEQLRKLRAEIKEDIRDFLNTQQGSGAQIELNIGAIAGETNDPEGFTDVYEQFVKGELAMDKVGNLIAEKFNFADLQANIISSYQKALGADANAIRPSNKEWLHKVHSDLGKLTVLTTLVNLVSILTHRIDKLPSYAH